MQYLKGQLDENVLEEEAQRAAGKFKKTLMLNNMEWACRECHKAMDWKCFIPKGSTGDDWYKQYWSTVIAPGDTSTCLDCKGQHKNEYRCE
eukprot:7741562-Karenia_brevis.AAC.1